MDIVRLATSRTGFRFAVAAIGFVFSAGVLAAPMTVAAAEPTQHTPQSAIDAYRARPGFQEHREVRNGDEHVDINVCSTAIAANQVYCDARVRTDSKARSARP